MSSLAISPRLLHLSLKINAITKYTASSTLMFKSNLLVESHRSNQFPQQYVVTLPNQIISSQ